MLLCLFSLLLLSISNSVANVIPRSQYITAFDISGVQGDLAPDFWHCTRNAGYQKVILEGFNEADDKNTCGGSINDGFIYEYAAAMAVGYRADQIDSYFFPLPLSWVHRHQLYPLPIQEQLNIFTKFLDDNAIKVNTIWLDIEPKWGLCDGWKRHDTKANENLAKSWIQAIDGDTRHKWGIYTPNTGNQWASLFGNQNTDIASHLPLWVVQVDTDPDPSSYKPLVGGWKYATGKQWAANTKAGPDGSCKGNVDLDSFIPSSINGVAPGPPNPPVQGYSCQTTTDGLRYRLCVSTNATCTAIGQYPIGTMVEFKCQVHGGVVNSNPWWGKTMDGYFVSLAYIYSQCVAIIPLC